MTLCCAAPHDKPGPKMLSRLSALARPDRALAYVSVCRGYQVQDVEASGNLPIQMLSRRRAFRALWVPSYYR